MLAGPAKWRSTRFLLAYTISTGLMVVFYQRVSFSMAIVCMVNHTALAASTQHGQHWGEMGGGGGGGGGGGREGGGGGKEGEREGGMG